MTSSYPGFSGSSGLRPELPTPTGSEAQAFDHWAIRERGVPQSVLMDNAGRTAAHVLARCFPEGPIAVAVGPGHNGGDGWVLARTLRTWGRDVTVLGHDLDAGRDQRHGWELPFSLADADSAGPLAGAAVIVDAVLGTGLRGAPRPAQAELINRLNAAPAPVLALDVPSGLVADTGETPGAIVEARITVTFGAPKLGLLLVPGRRHTGRIVVTEIGFPPPNERLGAGRVLSTAWAHTHRPRRPVVTHKKAVGSVLVAAGDRGMAGAAVLAARAALRAGVGLVRVASDESNREVFQAAVPEALFVDRADAGALDAGIRDSDACVLGPGYGVAPERATELMACLDAPRTTVVLDADALTMVAKGMLPPMEEWGARHDLVATPHPGELGRLTSIPEKLSDHERLLTTLRTARAWQGTVLAKGTPSLVAAPDGRFLVDILGSSDLAAAGMGDALAGVVGALAAQGVAAFFAAGLALHDTATAHRVAGLGASLTPSDVIGALPEVLELAPRASPLDLAFVELDLGPRW